MQNTLNNSCNESEFKGVMIDTGAHRPSLMRLHQYMAFCREFSAPVEIRKSSKSVGGLGGAQLVAIGKEIKPISFPNIGIICDITFHIHNDPGTPSILSLIDLTRTFLTSACKINDHTFRAKRKM